MSIAFQPEQLAIEAFAQAGLTLAHTTPLQKLKRLTQESQELKGPEADQAITWAARGELRPSAGQPPQVWLHLAAQAQVPLQCQRCMAAVATPLHVDQWYRFVADEAAALAQDNECEEDLLVMESSLNLLALLEDELLMALPLVPMHAACATTPALYAPLSTPVAAPAKAHPFAALAQLKKPKGG